MRSGLALALVLLGGCAATGRVPERILARADVRAPIAEDELELTWHGGAGFTLRVADKTILLDPFVTRPGFGQFLFGRMVPDEATVTRSFPSADLILVGHSHFDHVMDVATIARRTEAVVAGSRTTCSIVEGLRLPAGRCRVLRKGERWQSNGFDITVIPSNHGETLFGVPIPGEITGPVRWTFPSAWELPMGGARIYVIRVRGVTIVFSSTAALPDDPLWLERAVPEGADILLTSVVDHRTTPGFARALITLLRPRVIIAHHFDGLFDALGDEPGEIQEPMLRSFVRDAQGAKVIVPVPFEPKRFKLPALLKRPRARISNPAL